MNFFFFICFYIFFSFLKFFVLFSPTPFLTVFILLFIFFRLCIICTKTLNPKMDFDILFNFLNLCIKTPNFFLNLLILNLKKIYIFLFKFKYFNTLSIIFKLIKSTFKNSFIFWRPLFKKTSYFGYFRSNRSKWLN